MTNLPKFLDNFPSPMRKWVQFYFKDSLEQLEKAEVISCDIFDTLLFRKCSTPHDLFQEVGLRLKKDGHLLIDINPNEFVAVRRRAEAKARAKAENSECTLPEIAQEMERIVSQETLQTYELAVESDYCFLNEPLATVLQHLNTMGKKIILTSDTYFSAKHIVTLLQSSGFPLQILDKLFASCDLRVNKAFGGLYKHIGGLYNLKRLIHIGDNYAVDITKANQYGITAQYIPQRGYLTPFLEREKALRFGGADLASSEALRELVGRQSIAESEPLQLFFTTGATIFGPPLASYAEWCIADCIKQNISDLLVCTREAETLVPLLKNAAAHQKAAVNVIPLYTSRQALCMASLSHIGYTELLELMNKRHNISYEQQFSNLGLNDERFYTLLAISDRHREPTLQELLQLIHSILQCQEAVQQIATVIRQKRNNFLQYFSTIKLSSHNIGIADLGYAGRTQKYFSNIIQSITEANIRGYYFYLNYGASDHVLEGRMASSYMGNYGREEAPLFIIENHPEALEQSLISNHGTILGYINGAPILESTIPYYYQVQETEAVRRGIIAFQEAYHKIMATLPSSEFLARVQARLDEQNKNILYRFFVYPNKAEALAFGRWVHDDNFGTKNKGYLCNPEQDNTLPSVYWPQGMYSIQEESNMKQMFHLLTALRDS